MDNIATQVEKCDSLQGFQFFNSAGGLSTSNIMGKLVKDIRCEYKTAKLIGFTVMPSKM